MMLESNTLIGFVATTDFDRARAFYEGVLGLKLVTDDGFAQVYRAGDNLLRVVQIDDFKPLQSTVLGWEVGDVTFAVSALAERGVEFERYPSMAHDEDGVWTAPNGDRVAWFCDADENTLSISQRV